MEVSTIVNAEKIACKRCGHEIGKIIDNTLWLVSGLLLSEAHGICAQCGESFHYTVTERQLKQLINLVLIARNIQY
jgi:ribosomal protein L37E